jgi:glycosyltransferase involved in cell wall biosynthesis
MGEAISICTIVPVYNHGLTVGQVISESSRHLPVIAVNDGSTDTTADVLAHSPAIEVISFQKNRGKGAALQIGFACALRSGFSHAVTMDADGQLPPSALPSFAAAARSNPSAIIVGVRDFARASAPLLRRLSNAISNFSFRLTTRIGLPDTQCGLRAYPLNAIRQLPANAERYAYELELLLLAARSGIPLIPQPVEVDYQAPTSRLSHFHPIRDFLRIALVYARIVARPTRIDPER